MVKEQSCTRPGAKAKGGNDHGAVPFDADNDNGKSSSRQKQSQKENPSQ